MTGMKAFAEQIIDVMNKEENGEMEFRTWKRLKNNGIESRGSRFMMHTGRGSRWRRSLAGSGRSWRVQKARIWRRYI